MLWRGIFRPLGGQKTDDSTLNRLTSSGLGFSCKVVASTVERIGYEVVWRFDVMMRNIPLVLVSGNQNVLGLLRLSVGVEPY